MIVGFGHRAQVGKDTAGAWLVEDLDEDGINVVITDVRYLNEVVGIWGAGGRVYLVERETEALHHPGEEQLDGFQDWDGVIDNNGSIEDLYGQVQDLVMGCTLDVD